MKNSKHQPMVSCIMPTYNRRSFIPMAIRYFLNQDYKNKELIVIDDGTDPVEDLIPDHAAIRYFKLEKKISLGTKLNLACRHAKGSILANWDDDDWYATRRLTYQIQTLETAGTDLCGLNKLLYYDLNSHQAYQYTYPANQRPWLLGSSLCYTRKLWDQHHFAEINIGMDGLFVWATSPKRITVLEDSTIAIHMIHDSNISPKKTEGPWWQEESVDKIREIMKTDWSTYGIKHTRPAQQAALNTAPSAIGGNCKSALPFQNVYACLVHEQENCIIDLVRNLHYTDPDSVIILYNGGENKDLLRSDFPYHTYGAVIYPDPAPVKHGYLHGFALDCMQFALNSFTFQTMTFVDSDQLAVRAGYSDYLGSCLVQQTGIGMLSNKPRRLTSLDKADKEVWPALQAFKEFELWKPLLKQFTNGENSFVHWTFWPSTVFTADAIRDLLALFRNNKTLQHIIASTKIWATEEVILPTLIRLLGYRIIANPCSYDFVKYKKLHGPNDIRNAMNRSDVFWVHPVSRNDQDPLRKQIRMNLNQYDTKIQTGTTSPPAFFSTDALIGRIRNIEGWLTDREAELLISVMIKSCKELTGTQHIVEIGSYHGKSTVLFASLIQAYFPEVRLHAIDPHDGLQGARDQGLKIFPPSFGKLKANIHNAGLGEYVDFIRANAHQVEWKKPISLLFIDGLHDYPTVSRDFRHFAKWLLPGAYIAFHDYADYFPGVKLFVSELIAAGNYRKIQLAQSLMILQKS